MDRSVHSSRRRHKCRFQPDLHSMTGSACFGYRILLRPLVFRWNTQVACLSEWRCTTNYFGELNFWKTVLETHLLETMTTPIVSKVAISCSRGNGCIGEDRAIRLALTIRNQWREASANVLENLAYVCILCLHYFKSCDFRVLYMTGRGSAHYLRYYLSK